MNRAKNQWHFVHEERKCVARESLHLSWKLLLGSEMSLPPTQLIHSGADV
jgi:hypothetical protein